MSSGKSAGGRTRTDMELPPEDFESSASTNFTTPANAVEIYNIFYILSSSFSSIFRNFLQISSVFSFSISMPASSLYSLIKSER